MPNHTISFVFFFRLNLEECERALLPTLEHASLVHSHIHHLTDQSDEAFVQTRNAIVYISVRNKYKNRSLRHNTMIVQDASIDMCIF